MIGLRWRNTADGRADTGCQRPFASGGHGSNSAAVRLAERGVRSADSPNEYSRSFGDCSIACRHFLAAFRYSDSHIPADAMGE